MSKEGLDTATWATSNNQILAFSVGNPTLIPENGTNETFGVVWQPTSIEVLENRLKSRNTDSNEDIKTRVNKAIEELNYKNQFDHCIINDDLNETLNNADNLIAEFLKK